MALVLPAALFAGVVFLVPVVVLLAQGVHIDGQWTPASRTFDDLNPSDNSLYAHIPDGSPEDTRRAIAADQIMRGDISPQARFSDRPEVTSRAGWLRPSA